MTLNEQALDVTYRVSYVDVPPLMKHLHPGKCNYVEATKIAIQGVKEYPNIFIWDGDTQDKAWYEKRVQPFSGKRVVE